MSSDSTEEALECMYSFEEYDVKNLPTLEVAIEVLKQELPNYFHYVDVQIVQCPNLSEAPYNLAFKGLGGNTAIIDVGGLSNLFPIPKLEKVYSLTSLIKKLNLNKNDCNKNKNFCFIGAGEGPHHLYGCSEWICNTQIGVDSGSKLINLNRQSKCVQWDEQKKFCFLKNAENDYFGLMANLFVCNGEQDRVIKIKVKNRENKKEEGKDFPSLLSKIFTLHFPHQTVPIGGIMHQSTGESCVHVMPKFLTEKMLHSDEVKNWLKLVNVTAPLNFVFVASNVSSDHPLQLRTVHTHGHNEVHGGHYHYDISPQLVEYEIICNFASSIYRVDKVSQKPTFEDDDGKLHL